MKMRNLDINVLPLNVWNCFKEFGLENVDLGNLILWWLFLLVAVVVFGCWLLLLLLFN
jgi:hypothetical protein